MALDPHQGGWIASLLLGGGSVTWYLIWGDGSIRGKSMLAAAFVASLGLLLIPGHGVYLFWLAQLTLLVVVFVMVFGFDWLMQFRRRW
ncbi:MAG TPA: hypothetical protein VH120_02050 [Gemmataceae bacterium]|nr:hypothetical protein [Gemmataceae bacterium]